MIDPEPKPARLRRLLHAAPEVAALVLGIALRLRMWTTGAWEGSYDCYDHMRYVNYIVGKHKLPPLEAARTAYHPPLFYWMAAWIVRHGGTNDHIRIISIVAGILGLLVLWLGLRRFLPNDRLARVMALLLAAVLPCSLHVDGMVSNEGLNALASTIALLVAAEMFRADGKRRLALGAAAGVALGLALLVKVSSLIFVGLIGLGAVVEWFGRGGTFRERLERAVPLVLAIEVALFISLPLQSRHQAKTGRLYPFGYDAHDRRAEAMARRVRDVPYWQRRPPIYFFGLGTTKLFKQPWYPTDMLAESRFWPALHATAFADFYSFYFAGNPLPGEKVIKIGNRPFGERAQKLMSISTLGGLPITLTVVAAWVALVWRCRRRRDLAEALLLAAPALAILAQIHFSVKFPHDEWGPVKAAYLRFAGAPLLALFGVGASWLWRRRWTRALVLIQVAGLVAVTAYTFYGRGWLPGPTPTIAPPKRPPPRGSAAPAATSRPHAPTVAPPGRR